ncbi:MAG TPA: ribose 5-phosphate isomerase B [Chthoniobacteraceae bacterium]|jgi:ribose 5-phosphate isomerase B|nr:ribose 5-phosphate isomerase B [Chthoniobacteraceae bacterium]
MKIAIGSDHGGYPLNEILIGDLEKAGHTVIDFGTHDGNAPDDYPDYSQKVGNAVRTGEADRGIVVCGSGAGAAIAANKIHGVRACLCHDTYSAHQAVEHDDMNVLCLGARIIGPELARELVRAFVHAKFSGEERHRRRLAKVAAIEAAGQ